MLLADPTHPLLGFLPSSEFLTINPRSNDINRISSLEVFFPFGVFSLKKPLIARFANPATIRFQVLVNLLPLYSSLDLKAFFHASLTLGIRPSEYFQMRNLVPLSWPMPLLLFHHKLLLFFIDAVFCMQAYSSLQQEKSLSLTTTSEVYSLTSG
jgi:uncharacterized membrane protein YcfT